MSVGTGLLLKMRTDMGNYGSKVVCLKYIVSHIKYFTEILEINLYVTPVTIQLVLIRDTYILEHDRITWMIEIEEIE